MTAMLIGDRPFAGNSSAVTTAAPTNMKLNKVSYKANTRPRNSSDTPRCTVVSTEIFTPWATNPSTNAAASRNGSR